MRAAITPPRMSGILCSLSQAFQGPLVIALEFSNARELPLALRIRWVSELTAWTHPNGYLGNYFAQIALAHVLKALHQVRVALQGGPPSENLPFVSKQRYALLVAFSTYVCVVYIRFFLSDLSYPGR
eukprot:scaffold889_cov379-Prasinococcus_capsulatus_cf.AAC.2